MRLSSLRRYRLATEYGTSVDFSELWDRLQTDGRCCGVFGPQDFSSTANRSYPASCCSSDISDQISILRRPMASTVVFRTDDSTAGVLSAQTNANLTELTGLTLSRLISNNREEIKPAAECRVIYQQGCLDKVIAWLRNTADILFVLGYCVIAFLKLSFLGILRYEIKEMIQKIKLLQAEMACEILSTDGDTQSQQQNYSQVSETIYRKARAHFRHSANRAVCCCKCQVQRPTVEFTRRGRWVTETESGTE